MNIATHDKEAYKAVKELPTQDLLVYAAKAIGKSPLHVTRHHQQIAKLTGRLTLPEYVRLGLFREDRFSEAERDAFLANAWHWPIAHKCNPQGWSAVAEDKVVADLLMRSSGVTVPESLAVIDRGVRNYPGLPKIDSADALRGLLDEAGNGPLFCKIVGGMVSFGAVRIEGHDATHLHCTGLGPVTYDAFLTDIAGENTYLIQRELTNHPDLAGYASALCTVRMVNLMSDDGVSVPFAAIKMPQGANIADAFWRPGNLACDIDVETGRIQRVARRAIEMEYLDDHPEVPGLMGRVLPFWDELKALNAKAAATYAPIRYQSADIAITAEGPVIVELNYGGGFDLPQYASGRGILTPEVRAFFEGHGVDFAAMAEAKKKKGLFGLGR